MFGILVNALAWLVVAFAVDQAQYLICGKNYGSPWNGIGCIKSTLAKKAGAPMVYRVLVPWLWWLLRKAGIRALEAYELLKIILLACALWSVELAWGREIAVFTAVLLPMTFMYDYWDYTAELIGINLALTGDIRLGLIGVVVFALSRETAVLSALAYWCASFDLEGAGIIACLALFIWVALRMIQGEHKLYCDRWMWKENIKAVKGMLAPGRPWWMQSIPAALVITVLSVIGAATTGIQGMIPLAILAAGWLMGKADETRIFAACLPWIAKLLTYA